MYIKCIELEKCDIYVLGENTEDSYYAVNLIIFIGLYMKCCGDATFE